jgi:hypothetical protein
MTFVIATQSSQQIINIFAVRLIMGMTGVGYCDNGKSEQGAFHWVLPSSEPAVYALGLE